MFMLPHCVWSFIFIVQFQMKRIKDLLISGIEYVSTLWPAKTVKDTTEKEDLELLHYKELSGLTIDECIKHAGYPVETHEVITEDGYILTMHRIPHGKNSKKNNEKPLLVMHGLLGSSYDFVLLPDTSLAYSLADNGYDVWLGNARGTTFSRKHSFLDKDSFAYWKFSMHEIGMYDLPAKIDHILATTQKDILCFIAFSLSSAAFCITASSKPEYNKKISLAVFLNPAVFVEHYRFLGILNSILPTTIVWYLVKIFAFIFVQIGHWQDYTSCGPKLFLPFDQMRSIARRLCLKGSNYRNVVVKFISAFLKMPSDHLAKNIIFVLFNGIPNTASVRQIVHSAQQIFSGKFRYFDYGTTINKEVYNDPIPPEYDFEKITVPVAIYHGKHDHLGTVEDIEKLAKMLPNLVHRSLDEDETSSHFNMLLGSNANKNTALLLELLQEKTKTLYD